MAFVKSQQGTHINCLDFCICHELCFTIGEECLEQDDPFFCCMIVSKNVDELNVLDFCFWELIFLCHLMRLLNFLFYELLFCRFLVLLVRVKLNLSFFIVNDLREVLSELFVVDPLFHGAGDTEVDEFFT